LRPLVDIPKLRGARKRLDDYFPDINALRHAIAYKEVNEAHPEVHAPDGQCALMGFREPDRFSAPHLGRLRYLDITPKSLSRIREVVVDCGSAFDMAAAELERQGHLD